MIEEDSNSKGPNVPNIDIGHLASVTRRALKRIRTKLQKQEEELKEAAQHDHFSQIADSLLAFPAKVTRGASSFAIENIHTQATENILLDPAKTVFDNAQEYYKRSRKAKRGLAVIEKNVNETKKEETTLLAIAEKLEALRSGEPPDPGDFASKAAEAAAALEDLGILPRKREEKARNDAEKVPYRHFTLNTWNVYVGKNDSQNDELSTRFAKPWDLWMHVAACAGSHVVIKREKNAVDWPPREVLLAVASFAVWFSKAKHTSYAEVHVTEARYVHKRRHSPPGEVMLDRFKTLRVSPKSPQDFFGSDSDM